MFDIPRRKDQSTLGARKAFEEAYGFAWPHDDDCLRQIAAKVDERTTCKTFMLMMIEQSGQGITR